MNLSKSDFVKIIPCLNNNPLSPTFAYAVAHGVIEGDIFVSSCSTIDTFLLKTRSGLYFADGDLNHSFFCSWFRDYLSQKATEKANRLTFFSPNKILDQKIRNTIGDHCKEMHRCSFDFNPCAYSSDFPSSSSIKEINYNYIKEHKEFNEVYYNKYWGSVHNFLRNGFGYCVVDRDQNILSTCTTIFRGGTFAEIDISTSPQHQGKGLATKVAHAFIKHCLQQQLMPRWDCDLNNESSKHLAKKLGFHTPKIYTIFARK
ncbi:GNAT family N-acetyltransferase [Bacillus sp. JZ8]